MADKREILFVAAEASGDLHASGVAKELGAALAGIAPPGADVRWKMVGVGGDKMKDAGVEILSHYKDLAVMGFVEVLKHIPKHAALLKTLKARMATGNVAAVVLIDYPGFNMKVGRAAKEFGIPVVYYVTPQVWAWGAGRLPKLAKIIDKAAPILPFEEPLLRKHGIDATFVGHPLLDRAVDLPSKSDARKRLGISETEKIVALFPGSRAQEISLHWDDFIATGKELQRRDPSLKIIVSGAPTVDLMAKESPFPIIYGASFDVLRAADAAVCKSGTTTLETAISECPMVLGYRTGSISYAIAKRLVKIPYIGLVNVVAGKGIVKEFIQDMLQPQLLADEIERLMNDEVYRNNMIDELRVVRSKLGQPGAAKRVANMVASVVATDN